MWSKSTLRNAMLLEKSFLSDVFHSNSLTIPAILQGANIFQLNILIKVLHFVASGKFVLIQLKRFILFDDYIF